MNGQWSIGLSLLINSLFTIHHSPLPTHPLNGGQEVQVCDETGLKCAPLLGFKQKTGKELYKKYLCRKFFNT